MRFKVGDRVRIKSLDWYNKNRNDYGHVVCGNLCFNSHNKHWCGKIVTIKAVYRDCYLVKENDAYWNDIMIEGLVEDETEPKYEDEVNGEYYSTPKYLIRPSGYQFVDENGNVINAQKIVLEKKKKEYPKTYEECCRVLGISDGEFMFSGLSDDEYDLFDSFVVIKRCRDAYWKIAGEEMGLGKPWEPDWEDVKSRKYVIVRGKRGKIITGDTSSYARTFAFPTKEMRDAFKTSNEISKLIEECKEFL